MIVDTVLNFIVNQELLETETLDHAAETEEKENQPKAVS